MATATASASAKPRLAVSTPVTATFPSHISARSPLSAKPLSAGTALARTPISPPVAYTDFLRFMNLNSPATCKITVSGESTPASMPSTASTSAPSDCSCKVEFKPEIKSEFRAPMSAPPVPPSPFAHLPMSAPATGAQVFPSLRLPPSPADGGNYESPISAYSPFSARSTTSTKSKFDWEAALKMRKMEVKKASATSASRTTVRHIREVVTRTVTYTPRMAPAPKGKRRKLE